MTETPKADLAQKLTQAERGNPSPSPPNDAATLL